MNILRVRKPPMLNFKSARSLLSILLAGKSKRYSALALLSWRELEHMAAKIAEYFPI
jgi:hypothetical protein